MRLILVRHGQSPSNLTWSIDTTVPGPRLTELGVEQAEALPAALAAEQVDAIYASTMTRAQMTAEPLARVRGLTVQVRDGLREITAGDLEMRNDDEAIKLYLATAFAWAAGDVERRMPGGENGVEAFARFDAVVAEAAQTTAGAACLVSHGAAIRMWVAGRSDNVDAAFVAANPLQNTGVIVLEGSPGAGWHVESWTDFIIAGVPVTHGEGPGGEALTG
jgi:broad specificity phosphatase PhoE